MERSGTSKRETCRLSHGPMTVDISTNDNKNNR